MSTLTDDLKKYLQPALTALMDIQTITGVGGTPAEEVIAAVNAIVAGFIAKLGADVTPATILADMAAADKSIAGNDAAADAALAAKFPVESSSK